MGKKESRSTISRIIIGLVTAIVLPANLFSIYTAAVSQQITQRTAENSLSMLAVSYSEELEGDIRVINNYIAELEENDQNLELLTQETDYDRCYIAAIGLVQEFHEHMQSYEDADAYFVYSDVLGQVMGSTGDHDDDQSWFREAAGLRESLDSGKWVLAKVEGESWLLHINRWKSLYLGGGINLSGIIDELKTQSVYSSLEAWVDETQSPGDITGMIAHTVQFGRRNVYLHMTVSRQEVLSQLPLLERFEMAIAIAGLLIIPLLVLVLEHFVLRPLKRLTVGMKELESDLSVRISDRANSRDFAEVYGQFNKMAGKIENLTEDIRRREKNRRVMEMRNLNLQVKPHFLFNSFNLIVSLIRLRQYDDAKEIVLYLSDYFRYLNVSSDSMVSVSSEIEMIRKYLKAAAIRYPDLFESRIDLDPAAAKVCIPQLLLHNFVENFIKHGLDLDRVCHLLVQVTVKDGKLHALIRDDGVGMEEGMAENISEGHFEEGDGRVHVGMQNSYLRMKYYYGEDGSFTVKSAPGKGTQITVILPAEIKGTAEYETSDRK